MNLLRTRILSATRMEKENSRKVATKKLSLTKLFLQHIDLPEYKAINGKERQSLLLYEAYANESSQICPFLALRPEFHSNLRVILSSPRYCQSATFGRLTFCVYTLLFYGIRV